MSSETLHFKRVLLKLSGEALRQDVHDEIYDFPYLDRIAEAVKESMDLGCQVAIVVDAGNIWRGKYGVNMDRAHADHMGMLATAINTLALRDVFCRHGIDAVAMTAVAMHEFAEPYCIDVAISHLEEGKAVILGCGLGVPYFTTDTAAVLRAAELKVDAVLMAKNIDGIYNDDPRKNPAAVKYDELDFDTILEKHLAAIDSTAAAFAQDNHLPIQVFGLDDPHNIVKVVTGEKIGTVIKGGTK